MTLSTRNKSYTIHLSNDHNLPVVHAKASNATYNSQDEVLT